MKVLTISIFLLLLFPLTHAQVSMEDSLALVVLYNTTNGPEWDVDSNWLDGPVSSWHGITVNNNRVEDIARIMHKKV